MAAAVLALTSAPGRPAGAAVVAQGEIVVIEGSAATVEGSPGAYAINFTGNIDAIVSEFYTAYPDEFDMISIWTSFPDLNNGGAYYTTPPPLSSKLIGFINMNQVGVWSGFGALSTLGQEFGHAWLSFEVFVDPATGMISDELLGRDGSHWSSLLDAEGSVMDGVDWQDNGDGTFTVVSVMDRFGPLDLYVMGYLSADEVPPFYLLRDAGIGPLAVWEGLGPGQTVAATKVPLTVQDIIAASGPQPPIDTRQKDYRVAFVIVTEPGQPASAVTGMVQEVESIRQQWDEIYVTWTMGRGTMCTDTSAPCDIPRAMFAGGRVLEGTPSDGDGVAEPGEHARVEIDWRNTGNAVATGAIASLAAQNPDITAPADVPVPDIPVDGISTAAFDLLLPPALACGEEHVFTATARLGQREWNGAVSLIPGVLEGPVEGFATDAGWRGDLAGTDTASTGGWDYGPAEETTNQGRQLQPAGGRGGPTDSAWWTGRDAGYDWNSFDVDTGYTTLTSAPFDVAGKLSPVLRYYVWYQAWVFNVTPPAPAEGDDLVVEVSADDGATWVEVDRVSGEARLWERREARLEGKIPANATSVIFRFTAQDVPPTQNLVEVGIDDVSLYWLSPSCGGGGGGGGCGCAVARRDETRGALAGGAGIAMVLAWVVARGRRR